ncbi:hypothetical protein [Streptomyces sp. NBC_00203]|uniref:hypothetical protein n=1 Tax=Streptomyces sp. NBC_00203 TaxID=2975680 RepID=UPI00324C245C
MPTLATRPRRLALACALITAATLGTVSASTASASDTPARTTASPTSSRPAEPAKGAALAIAYEPTANAPGDVNTANKNFAACMREQGQKYFPGFHAAKDKDGRATLRVRVAGKDFDPTADGYQDALDACESILKAVGITFPDAPDGLPALPSTPGKGEPPALRRHVEPGHPGKPDLPSLSSVPENA